jgi:transposase
MMCDTSRTVVDSSASLPQNRYLDSPPDVTSTAPSSTTVFFAAVERRKFLNNYCEITKTSRIGRRSRASGLRHLMTKQHDHETRAAFAAALGCGRTRAAAARLCGVSRATGTRWCQALHGACVRHLDAKLRAARAARRRMQRRAADGALAAAADGAAAAAVVARAERGGDLAPRAVAMLGARAAAAATYGAPRTGPRPKMPVERRRVVLGWVLQENDADRWPTGADVQAYVAAEFGVRVSRAWVSRLLRGSDVRARRVRGVHAGKSRKTMRRECVRHVRNVAQAVRDGGFDAARVLVADETNIRSDATVSRGYASRAHAGAVHRVTSSDKVRSDTLMATVAGDGSMLQPYFIAHRERRFGKGADGRQVVLDKGCKGMSKALMLRYVAHIDAELTARRARARCCCSTTWRRTGARRCAPPLRASACVSCTCRCAAHS